MRYAGIIKNDLAAAPGISFTFFSQGCSHHCPGCQNQQTWDFDGGKEFTQETLDFIKDNIDANGIERTFCVMGGEPLHPNNLFLTNLVINEVRKKYPDIKIYLWTGYLYKDLIDKQEKLL